MTLRLGLLLVMCVALTAVCLVLGTRQVRVQRGVERIRVPARLISGTPAVNGRRLEVEYPAPDGSPLRAEISIHTVNALRIWQPFDGSVWVNRDDPTDVTARSHGRSTRAVVLFSAGFTFAVVAFGLGVVALIMATEASIRGG